MAPPAASAAALSAWPMAPRWQSTVPTITCNRLSQEQGPHSDAGLPGDVGFSKRGNGILTMDVANSYTGATTITGGALLVPDLSFLSASSAISISTSGTLALTGTTLNRNISAE
jgi:autotransporter-associated beta strand protein